MCLCQSSKWLHSNFQSSYLLWSNVWRSCDTWRQPLNRLASMLLDPALPTSTTTGGHFLHLALLLTLYRSESATSVWTTARKLTNCTFQSSAWSTVHISLESPNHCLFANKTQADCQPQECWPPAPYSWKPKVMLILSPCHLAHCGSHVACLIDTAYTNQSVRQFLFNFTAVRCDF